MHIIPGLSLRVNEDAEILGIDDAEMGEFAYDYVGIEQEIGHTLDTGVGVIGGEREPDYHLKSVVSTVGSVSSVRDREKIFAGSEDRH